MNLNKVVSGVLGSVTPREDIALFRCTGQANVKGRLTPTYAPFVELLAKVQSVSDEALKLIDRVGDNSKLLHFYLDGDWRGVFRPDGTGGDMIYARQQWWLINAVPEDFSHAGWVCVRGVLQMTGPAGVTYP
ncbi:MAG TPA: hypothetical protein VNV36_05230 [Pseudomonas sp.]|uniref:hypothetical protein n=1 Tax=Pseudomonas sp. TaxID=306 RepID=UPI002D1327C8|nr:hypothetical protein [Pseudomonas sp.]HWH86164.1 hypothetical protein [Pseudomonas sp.]